MTYTVEVRSVDLNVTLPSTALYQVGATVVLADGDYDVIPQDYIAHHLTVTDASPGTPLSHPAPSGGSVANSALATAVLNPPTGLANQTLATLDWNPDSTVVVGSDVSLNVDGQHVDFATTGLYVVHFEGCFTPHVDAAVDFDGVAFMSVGATTLGDTSDFQNFGNELQWAFHQLHGTLGKDETQILTLILRVEAGDSYRFRVSGLVTSSAGSLDVSGQSQLLVRRFA